jgi:Flp pilus assembly secretin CpaC
MMVESSRRGPMRAVWEKWRGIFVAGMCAASCAAGQLLFGQENGNALTVLSIQYSVPSAESFVRNVPVSAASPLSSTAHPPSFEPSAVNTADYETRSFMAQSVPAPAPLPAEEFGRLPEGSPFEAIPQSGSIKLQVRRSVLLRTKVDVYRTAIVDDAVCDIVQLTPREISIIGRSMGQTHVTFWFDDPAMAPLTYLVEVKPDTEQIKRNNDSTRSRMQNAERQIHILNSVF